MTLAQGAGLNETVVGVAVIVVAGALFLAALKLKSGEDMTKALGVLGTLFGSVIAGTGTYFFTKPAIEEAQAGREAAENRVVEVVEAAEQAVEDYRTFVDRAAQEWAEVEKSLSGVEPKLRVEANRAFLKGPEEFAKVARLLPDASRAPAEAAAKKLEPEAKRLRIAESVLRTPIKRAPR